MKQISNKFIAICLYFVPYLGVVVGIILYGIIVNVVNNAQYGGAMVQPSLMTTLLTYVPMAVALIVVALCVSKSIRKNYDLSIIGVQPSEQKKENGRVSFLIVVFTLILAFVSIGFASSVSYVKKKQVGGSPSYYIIDMGFLGVSEIQTVLSSATEMEYDGETFTITLTSGKKYTVKKNTEAGKIVSELFFG